MVVGMVVISVKVKKIILPTISSLNSGFDTFVSKSVVPHNTVQHRTKPLQPHLLILRYTCRAEGTAVNGSTQQYNVHSGF